ncbi:MAG: lipoprotein signal peptidase [Bacteroidaceae bacterium]|nr:lipoprotein signal peptidase [Bacteroidaceae bacterium]
MGNPTTVSLSRRQWWQFVAAVALVVGVVGIDQWIKIWVKTDFYLHESRRITDWFYLVFTENNGMAFGMEVFNKYFLTSFRIVAVCVLGNIIVRCIRKGTSWGFLTCLALVMAGAMGNIFDCLFYGLIFNNPPAPLTAEFVAWGTGYGELFLGRVVDMFYFPLVSWDWPLWMPMVGGQHFIFFSPIFNFADAAISCGMIAMLLCYRHKLQQ